MRRRSVMAMLGLSPIAASVGGAKVATAPGYSLGGFGSAAVKEVFSPGYDYGPPAEDRYGQLNYAQEKLKALRWRRERGLNNGGIPSHGCHCIESRRATSPAIKAILQHEHYQRQELLRAENDVATELMKIALPFDLGWMRKWL